MGKPANRPTGKPANRQTGQKLRFTSLASRGQLASLVNRPEVELLFWPAHQ
jgi:hypothetical protein